MGPSFDRDSISESNGGGHLFGGGGSKSHFRSVVQPKTIRFFVGVLGELGYDSTLGGNLLGRAALLAAAARAVAVHRPNVGRSPFAARSWAMARHVATVAIATEARIIDKSFITFFLSNSPCFKSLSENRLITLAVASLPRVFG